MDIRLPAKRVLLAIITLVFSLDCIAQLPAFTLDVTPVAQTCLGNGSLGFTVAGNNPSASIDYAVYLLPNTTTPLVITTSPNATGLVAGNYLVVATQSLGGESNTATDTVTIGNNIIPLTYSLIPTPVHCGNDGKITVNVLTGVAVSYEIISGPVTVALQSSNVFNNLPAGTYNVRVYDNCGEAVVTTLQLVQVNTGLTIAPVVFTGGELPSCNTITISHNIQVSSSAYQVFYPLTCQFTVFPPGGGAPIVTTQVIASGAAAGTPLSVNIPFYYGQQYAYNIKITDACGNVYTRNNVIVNKTLSVEVSQNVANCGDNAFSIKPNYYVGPVTVNFTAAPTGFNPVAFNPSHPTFDDDPIPYGDVDTNPVPHGNYTVQITDACGHTATQSFEIHDPEITPQIVPQVLGCAAGGSVSIEIPGRTITSVIITAAPAAYPGTLDDDVSEFITPTGFFMENLPLGHYAVTITDSCGDVYNGQFDLAASAVPLSVSQNPGCETGFGSLRITSPETTMISVRITAAPATFTGTLPLVVTANIATNGRFYMNSLPEGAYTFEVIDNCGAITNQNVVIEGYHIQLNDVAITPNCNSFNLSLHHTSNGNNLQTFWLQRYDPVAGVWEHPISGADYAEGATPNTNTAYLLNNNANNINIGSTGHFRVIKLAYIWSNGSAANFRCLEQIYEFDFDGGPVITDAYSFPCAGGLTEVIIVAEGVPPLTYKITLKNNQPFVVNNGTSNLFSGLEPATYNFQVTDVCGNIRNIQFDINSLDPIALTADGFCEGEASSLSVDEFSFLNYQWWKAGAPGTILSTTGTLNFPAYNSATQAGTYFVSITSPTVGSCISQVLQYQVLPNTLPVAGNDNSISYCNDGQPLNLTAYLSSPHDVGGTWEDVDATGALSGNIFNTAAIAPGTYRFAYKVTGVCDLEDEAVITIELKNRPQAPLIAPIAAVCEGSTVQFSVTAAAGATYQWTGPNNFISTVQNPTITNSTVAQSGNYSLTVTVDGCASPPSTVSVTINSVAVAGQDNSLSFCNDGQPLNLEDYLSLPHSTGGIWQDMDNSGALAGNIFNTSGLAAGTYHFRYTVTSACGLSDDAVITIELRNRPQAPLIAPVAPVCEGGAIQFSVTAVTGAAYQWTGPNNFTSAIQNPFIPNSTTSHSGTYSLTVTTNGCSSPPSTISVMVNTIPQFTVEGDSMICEGQSSLLSVIPGNFAPNAVAYTWYHDGEQMTGIDQSTIEVFETGLYKVEVGSNGCVSSREITVTQNTNAFAVALEAGCRDTEYVIAITNLSEMPGASFLWTGPGGYSHTGEEAVITDGASGEYFVEVTNAEGCSQNASIVVDNTSCFIPRGISPNGDGLNDSFDLSNLDIKHIEIFNRYGLQVYEKDGYISEWHGQSHRGHLPTGVYYYVLTLSAGKQVTGWVYLQREIK
ncbi:hypothetical protein HYN59_01550 [Flavobacterium album]|uniref:Ig-like domain-containing protein n=1 Tax=Flavobacterium album TaxID=2175091 RepID=A0A2S1QTX6_9FLAO|nr:gliding motility-associated C-terminal domain-containing protein [Flavobacterium album]AWH83880.1 hypothetical protein HYN59_01550 [Flavobacterium album]